MTIAVCYHCGAMKFGAFNPCAGCGASPQSEDDFAISLAMTDHYFPKSELEKLGEQVARGEKLQIDPEVHERFVQLLRSEKRFQAPVSPDEVDPLDFPAKPEAAWWAFWKK